LFICRATIDLKADTLRTHKIAAHMNRKNKQNTLPTVNEEFYELLFNSTDQGFALLKKISSQGERPIDFEYLKVNRAFERHSGLHNVIGKTVRDVVPTIKPELMALFDSVICTGQKIQFEEFILELDNWYLGEVFATGITDTVAFLFNNITERKRIELILQESKKRKAYLLKLSDALRNIADSVEVQAIAARLLGEHLRVNQVHYGETIGEFVVIHQGWGDGLPPMVGTFRQQDFGKRLHDGYRAGQTQFSYDIQTDSTITDAERNVISGAGFHAYVAVPLIKNGEWVSTLAVHSINPRKWTQSEIDLVQETAERTWDAVERARAEASLRESEIRYKNEAARLRAMLTSISDAVYIGDVSGITFANQAALDQLGYDTFEELNRNIEVLSVEIQTRDAVSHEVISLDKQVFARALAGETAVQNVEVRHRSSGNQRIVMCAASPVIVDGNIVAAVAINTDITEQWQLTLALQNSEERFRSYVMAGSDFVFSVSPDWNQMTILKNDHFRLAIAPDGSNWMAGYIPDQDQEPLWQLIQKAIAEGKMFDLEHEVIMADGGTCWMHCRALPVFDFRGKIVEWRGAGSDITIRKKAAQQLLDYNERLQQEVGDRTAEIEVAKDQLQSILDTTLMQLAILEAVRDEHGKITDLEIKLVNKEMENATGRTDLAGKKYAEEYPGIRQIGLFDLIIAAIETGHNQHLDYYYPHEGFNLWFSSVFVKLGDGVVATNMDITDRKQAEEERFKNYLLLQQSEELALLGNWDYDVEKAMFTWSDGMYRLFNLNKGLEIEPEIYLQYATEAGMPAARRVVKHIRDGDRDFEETLEIDVDGRIKLLRLKATVVKDEEGQPLRVLGVDMDVTAMHAAEATIRKMQAEQQLEIFRVSLSTLEEERQRISESLHNGLGQLLYGIKINFSALSKQMEQQTFDASKSYANELLTAAIKESRRISHELMPTILEDFGLKTAIEDICQQLQEGIKWNCAIKGISKRLDKYLELAVYRTAQELMTNVMKHAGATRASIKVTGGDKGIRIGVSDDGRGMNANKTERAGIGLASIRSKINLLNGTMNIHSDDKNGTTIEVFIPV
jgi:PAS domain S-box-containing protein